MEGMEGDPDLGALRGYDDATLTPCSRTRCRILRGHRRWDAGAPFSCTRSGPCRHPCPSCPAGCPGTGGAGGARATTMLPARTGARAARWSPRPAETSAAEAARTAAVVMERMRVIGGKLSWNRRGSEGNRRGCEGIWSPMSARVTVDGYENCR